LNLDILELLNGGSSKKILRWLDRQGLLSGISLFGWNIATRFLKFDYKKHEIYMIGQSHLDACWTWTKNETILKNYKTFKNALKYLENYPFFKFSCSSPCYYNWMEKYYPKEFEKIKKYVAEGRIELVGGMWIEPDINLISGESLVRQRFYGQRYYLEKFGKISKIGWLSDTFGYCWTLPQILKKSGSDYFYTNKMQWSDTNDWPFVAFYWQSQDGSKVLAYTYSYTLNLLFQTPNLGDFTKVGRLFKNPGFVFNYEDGFQRVNQFKGDKPLKEFGFVYGIGDGGGGPILLEILFFKELYKRGIIKDFITMEQYFKILEKYEKNLPIWNDEMYLEYHRGCYTSHAWIKVENRNAEQLLFKTEALATIGNRFKYIYPKNEINSAYKKMLFNQFHDILPGSAISEVYEDSKRDYKEINETCNTIIKNAMNSIIKSLKLNKGLVIFNPLNWERNAIIQMKIEDGQKIIDNNKKEIPIQKLENDEIIFITPNIPSVGMISLSIEKSQEVPQFKNNLKIKETNSEIILENQYIIAIINKNTGNLNRIYHKKLKKEILSGEGNKVEIFKEKFGFVGFTAWNLDRNYYKRPKEVSLESISIKEHGPVRIRVEIIKKLHKSKIWQSIILYNNIDRIDFNIRLNFHEKFHLVKITFPINVETDKINCEIPFGYISRATKPKNSAQKAMFEIPAQRWVDFSNDEFGVTLINKSRYGFDARYDDKLKNILRMTILRKPKYPPKGEPLTSIFPSRKFHEQVDFSVDYSIFVHKGDLKASNAHIKGLEFNIPVIYVECESNNGEIELPFEFISIKPENVVLSALKQSEDDENAIVIRVYESLGKECKCKIKFNSLFSISNVKEVDLLELNPKDIQNFTQNQIIFDIGKFEIKTLKIYLKEVN